MTLEQLKNYIKVNRDKKPDFKKYNIEDLYEKKKEEAQKSVLITILMMNQWKDFLID